MGGGGTMGNVRYDEVDSRGIGEDGMGERKKESECYEVERMVEERSKIGSGVDEHKWR